MLNCKLGEGAYYMTTFTIADQIEAKIGTGPLTTFETWLASDNGPEWLTPLAEIVDEEGRNRLFKSGEAGANGEAVDGFYTLNMRGLSKVLMATDSVTRLTGESVTQLYGDTETQGGHSKHKIYQGMAGDEGSSAFSYSLEFGRGGAQEMGLYTAEHTQILTGGAGNDIITGGAGDDIIAGNLGNDEIAAGDGEDLVKGGAGEDEIYGGDGNDYLVGDYADSDRHETRAEDRGGADWDDTIYGDAGDDMIFGNQGDDTLEGGSGDDTLEGGSGDDTLEGGSGDDTAVFSGSVLDYTFQTYSHMKVVDKGLGRDGVDMVSYDIENYQFAEGKFAMTRGHNAGDNKTAQAGVNSLLIGLHGHDTLTGADGDDVLIGDNGLNFPDYNQGDDILKGNDGNDILIGGGGSDKLFGGNGNDILLAGADDYPDEATKGDFLSTGTGINLADGGEGEKDHLNANGSNGTKGVNVRAVTSGSNLEAALSDIDVATVESGTQTSYVVAGLGSGAEGANDLFLDADYQASTLRGLHDEFVEVAGINEVANATLAINVEQIKGTQYRDFMFGHDSDDASDYFWGGAGDDVLDGGAGDDHLHGESGDDIVRGGAGDDELLGGEGNDKLYGHDGDDKLLGHSGDDEMYGGVGNDKFYGGVGDDVMMGHGGDDLFWQQNGFGNDEVDGHVGSDQLSFFSVTDDLVLTGTNFQSNVGSNFKGGVEKRMEVSANGETETVVFKNVEILSTGKGNDVFDSQTYVDLDLDKIYMRDGDDEFRMATLVGDELDIDAGAGNDTVEIGGRTGTGFAGVFNGLANGGEGFDTLHIGALSKAGVEAGDHGEALSVTFNADGASGKVGYLNGIDAEATFKSFEEIVFASNNDRLKNAHYVDATAATVGLTLDTGKGDDTVLGGSGDDVINGGGHDDILSGGAGADTFVFEGSHGHDTVMDFVVGEDLLDVTGLAGFEAAWQNAATGDGLLTVANGNTTISYNNQSITLENVTVLTEDAFVF